jgi:serine/threonine-protein kinase/endoribonuclease IRE1
VSVNSSVLQFYENGTIQLVDRSSQSPLWEISTGPPLSDHITTAESGLNYLIYPLNGNENMNGNGTELWEVYNGNNVVCFSETQCFSEILLVQTFLFSSVSLFLQMLPWKLEEFVARSPYIRDSVVTVGSKASTVFVVDADNGEVIYKRSIPAPLNELEGPGVEGAPPKLNARTSDDSDNIIVVVRTDYSLSASDLGKHLFNWTRTSFTANYYMKYSHPDMLDQSSCLRGDIPCIRTEGLPLALPDSDSANAIILRDEAPITTRDGTDVLKLLQTSRKLPKVPGKSNIVLDDAQNQTHDARSHFISPDPEATNTPTRNIYRWLFPLFPIFLVIGYLLSLTSANKTRRQFVIQLMRPFVREKKPVDIRGRSEGTPNKRRKTRKKDGLVNGHETLSVSDKENNETGGSTEAPVRENSAVTDKGIIGGLDGRQIGKLFVSNKEIGRGSNGTVVFEGSYDGRQVAVKRLLRSHNDIAEKETQNLIISDQDPNIVRLYGCEHDSDFVYISLERCQCSLADLIQKQSSLSSGESIANIEVSISIKSKISNVKGVDLELWTQDGLPSAQLLKLMRYVDGLPLPSHAFR